MRKLVAILITLALAPFWLPIALVFGACITVADAWEWARGSRPSQKRWFM